MQATFENNKEFTKLIGVLAVFDKTFTLKCSKDGISIFCMDSSHTSVLQVFLNREYFKTYRFECTDTDRLELGVSADVLMNTMKGIKKTDVFHLTAKSGEDKMTLQIDSDESQMVYEMKLMDLQEEELDIPEMQFNVKMKLEASVLKLWKTQIGDHTNEKIKFKVLDDKMEISSDGMDISVKSTLCHGDSMSIELFDDPCVLELSHKCVAMASRICDVANDISFAWTNGAPVNVGCKLGSGTGTVTMWFAPCLEADDEEMTDAS
jgi:proliferating cell nuclear antigen PCNA